MNKIVLILFGICAVLASPTLARSDDIQLEFRFPIIGDFIDTVLSGIAKGARRIIAEVKALSPKGAAELNKLLDRIESEVEHLVSFDTVQSLVSTFLDFVQDPSGTVKSLLESGTGLASKIVKDVLKTAKKVLIDIKNLPC